jgi:hypothetical protein
MSLSRLAAVLAVTVPLAAGCGSTSTFGGKSERTSSATRSVRAATSTAASPTPVVTSIDGSFQTVLPTGFVDATRSVRSGVANVQLLAVGPRANGFATNINVIREPSGGRSDIEQITRLEITTIQRISPRANRFSRPTAFTVGGEPARSVDYYNRPAGERLLHQRQVFVAHGRTIYTITYSALPDAYEANLGAVGRVVTGWRWR